ncbi:unnamed protein product [Lasius platythorax]|uniref:Uncharacterized protein n=1 Tax=Lasius platythorax TaxID=488582 RepID=A0AAV2NCQ0_9HYME
MPRGSMESSSGSGRDNDRETEESWKDDNQEGTANILNLGRIFLTSRNEFILRATSVPRSSLAKYLALFALGQEINVPTH